MPSFCKVSMESWQMYDRGLLALMLEPVIVCQLTAVDEQWREMKRLKEQFTKSLFVATEKISPVDDNILEWAAQNGHTIQPLQPISSNSSTTYQSICFLPFKTASPFLPCRPLYQGPKDYDFPTPPPHISVSPAYEEGWGRKNKEEWAQLPLVGLWCFM